MITRTGSDFIRLKNFRTWDFSKLKIEANERVQHWLLSWAVMWISKESWHALYASLLLLEHTKWEYSEVPEIVVCLASSQPHVTICLAQPSSQYLCFKNPVRSFYSFLTNDLFCFLGTIGHIVFLLRSFHFDVLPLTARGNVVDQKRSIAVVQLHCKQQVQQLLQESHSFSCSFSGMKEGDVATYFSGKSET